jgi:hypothetical protein
MEPQPTEPKLLETRPAHLIIWTKKDGLEQDHKAIEQCRKRASV